MGRQAPAGVTLVSIRDASRRLGVSEVTLRQWTNAGAVKAFVTPGGHRRYSLADLDLVVRLSRSKAHRVRELIGELGGTDSLHRGIARTFLESSPLLAAADSDNREALAALGKRLFSLTQQYVVDSRRRAAISEEAHKIGYEFGVCLGKLGLPLTDAIRAIIRHRDLMIRVATDFVKRRGPAEARAVDAVALVVRISDETIIALVEAYREVPLASREAPRASSDI